MPGDVAAEPPRLTERRLRSDVFLMLACKVGVLLLNIAGTVVVARYLGPSGRGTVAVAFNLTLILVQIGTLGLLTANPYFAAKDPAALGRIVSNSLWLAAGLGSLLFLVGVLLKVLVPDAVAGLGWTELIVALVGIPAALATQFFQSILLGEARTLAYNLVELTLGVVTLAALVIGFAVFDMGVLGAISLMTAGYVVGVFVYLGFLLRHAPQFTRPSFPLIREMLGYAFRIYVATLVSFLVIRIDLLLVNSYLGPDQAGTYSVAAALGQGLYLLPTVVGLNLFARVARGSGGAEMSAQVFRSISVLYGLLCLITVPFAGPAIRFLYGEEFASSTELYYWLLPGIFSLGMLTILSHHFAGRGFPLSAMLVWFVGLAVNLAINVAFLPGHGTYVASLASSVAYTLLLVLHMQLFAREVGGYGALRPRLGETVRFTRTALGRTGR